MNTLAALREQAADAATTIALAHPDWADIYARPVDDPAREWATLIRLELDDLADAVADLHAALTADLHTEEHR